MLRKMISLALAMSFMLLLCGCNTQKEGYVYYLNFKPEADSAWQELAKEYTERTGIQVKVVTAASNTYDDTLSAQLNKTFCPTLFICNNAQGLEDLGDYPYDLRNTALAERLESTEYCLWGESGEMYGMGFCYEAYGIITNKALLKQAGYSIEDIQNFEDLKSAAEDIHSRSEILGFDAFTSSGLDPSSSWRFSGHLSNMPLYYELLETDLYSQPSEINGDHLYLYKNIWDLYINNSGTSRTSLTTATGNMAEEEFGSGKAVFFQNGTWEYSSLTDPEKYGISPDDLTMIPIYCGGEGEENNALCCGTENYWIVNSKASPESINATLDFLLWVVTSEEGKMMLSSEFGVTPFKDSIPTENVFFNAEKEYEGQGKHPVPWVFCMTPNTDVWREGVTSSLAKYSSGIGTWDAVENAFVSGWRFQYRLEHGIM